MTFDRQPSLRVCDACARHVFATETTCPFCAAALAPVPRRPRFKLHPRLGRAQRLAIAGAVAGLIGCTERFTPLYGVPPGAGGWDGGSRDAGGAVRMDGGTPVVPTDADGGDASDDDAGDKD
jgi:hypothetical protein